MQIVFSFFFRLFLALVGAKLLARVVGLESPASLVALALLLLANLYLFDYLDYRSRSPWRRRRSAGQPETARAVQPSAPKPPEDLQPPPEN
jgi:hypothetical protein